MVKSALAMLAGNVSLNLLPSSQGIAWSAALACCLLLTAVMWGSKRSRRPWLLLVATTALCWAGWHAESNRRCVLDERSAGQDIELSGRIASLPDRGERVTRFLFEVDRFHDEITGDCLPRLLRLGWYHRSGDAPVALQAGQRWQLRLRLKPPYGFANPAGFDYERWLLQQGIHATGYVRKAASNRVLGNNDVGIDRLRERINRRLDDALDGARFSGLLQALATGTRYGIDASDWQLLIDTGTNHLIAISGLHIGLAAGFAWWLTIIALRLCGRHSWLLQRPAQDIAALASMLAAVAYAVLSGLAVPAQRALIMLACFVFAQLFRRNSRPLDTLSLALMLVLTISPLSTYQAGFWFSFTAVGLILLSLQAGLRERPRWQQFVLIQLVLSLGLLPLSLAMFQQGSLVSPLANLLMVPWISLLVVPLVLLSLLAMMVSDSLFELLLATAETLLGWVWPLLQFLGELEHGTLQFALPTWLLLAIAVFVLMSTRLSARGRRMLLAIASIAMLIAISSMSRQPPAIEAGGYTVDILDVGQGTAVVVRTAAHTLVYDTGARFSDSLDAGSAVVVPFLRHHGIGRIDRLLISHSDNDHIGGAASLLQKMQVGEVIGRQIDPLQHPRKRDCVAGMRWRYDGVDFEVLSPADGQDSRRDNDLSCVVRIAGSGGVSLLAGDIEARVERRLLRAHAGERLAADLLLVPHHGSRTSSTAAFVRAVAPDIAVITAGYRNRYRLPAADVVQRYRRAASQLLVSGLEGHIAVRFDSDGITSLDRFRRDHPAWWRHPPAALVDYGGTYK